ncbi:FAD-dependent monooxygenase [Williamsia maris]|uniref:2-polyprenyl-6-methoxyphenol hydroxylase n=1 Tax=Williamsia maris TaxID=72806 RepID=A0ABT1HFB6_9NOCA|nr:FAD-dependent monooxygenase [Williamsia maris]MCP2176932.1 2-polyprenyl-6-methoxyphenol hydroxylase [Williamsia maris]
MYDVIVVGGGPVGMLVANELALHDISAVVLESRDAVSEYPKAGTYHARAIATLARRQVVAVPRRTNDHTAISSELFQFAGYPWLTLRSRTIDGPVMMGIAQADLERAIAVKATSHGARVIRGITVASVQQSADHATVIGHDAAGSEQRYSARYVVGADGGRSAVLRSGQFDTTEYAPTMRAILGLAQLPHPEHLRGGWNHTDAGWTLLNLNRYGDSRIIVFEFDGPVVDRHAPVTPEEFGSAIDRVVGSHVELESPHYLNRFSDFSRIVHDYRDGRLFLAGDAAHIHYPLGGQGLNTGISDAVNLGWKLAAVVTGAADDSLLDTYSAERQPVGQWVIDNTRLQSSIMNPDASQDPMRRMVSQMLCNNDTHDWLGDKINGHSLRYESAGSSVGELDGEFLPDHEFVADGTRTTVSALLAPGRIVVLADAPASDRIAATTEVPFADVVVAEGLPESYPEIVVLRPDGYVAWSGAGSDVAQMVKVLDGHWGLRCPLSR